MHLLPSQLRATIYLINQTAFSPLTKNNTKSSSHQMPPKSPAQLSYGAFAQPLTAPASGGSVVLLTQLGI